MASGPITSWQTDEEKMETVIDFMFLGSKIIANGDCSHKIKNEVTVQAMNLNIFGHGTTG